MRNLSLIQRFSIIFLVVTIIGMITFASLLNSILEKEMINHAIHSLQRVVQKNVQTHFNADEFRVPITGNNYDHMSNEFEHLFSSNDIYKVKVWYNDMVVWFQDKEIIGQQFSDNAELKRSMQGEAVSKIVNINKIKNKYHYEESFNHLLELYVPIRFSDHEDIIVVFEIYKNFDHIHNVVEGHKKTIWLLVIGGSIVAYFLLFGIVRKGSKHIDIQTKELSQIVTNLEDEIENKNKYEEMLKKASDDWRATYDSTQDTILMLDIDHHIIKTNEAGSRLFKKSFTSLTGLLLDTELEKAGFPAIGSHLDSSISLIKRHEAEIYSDRNNLWMSVTIDPIMDKEARLTGLVVLMRDITEVKRINNDLEYANSQLERNSKKLQFSLYELTRLIDVVTNEPNTKIRLKNPNLERCYVIKNCKNEKCLCYGEKAMRCWQIAGTFCGGKVQGTFAQKYGNCAKCEVYQRASQDPVYGITEQFNNMMQVISIKQTELEKAYDELVLSQSALLQQEKMASVGTLAGGIAHDFNNIISVVTGYSELALKDMDVNNPLKDYISTIHTAGEKAASLTKELLAFSRKQPLEIKAINLDKIIGNMTDILSRLIGENIKLIVDYGEEIKNILGDKTQLEQVLLNFIVNARDAMPNGGHITVKTFNIHFKKAFTIRNEHIESGKYTVLSVKDSGQGISKEVQEHIFEPFFSTKGVGKGTGMGLSTVYGIVKQHKGYITFHSKLGEGTVFKVYLPTTDREIEKDAAVAINDLTGAETILAVDDEPLLIGLVVEMLEPLGYRVLVASNGEEALKVCNDFNGRIDLLLTDVIMPGMNGRELADEFIVKRPETKVIFMSGYTDDVIAHHGVLDEGVILINKPIQSSVVANKIREVLGSNTKKTDKQSAHEKLNGLKILLADDNEDIRKLVQVYIKDYNCKIDIAENGKIAVEKFKAGEYDLVLMDMQMPIMDGLTAVKEVRKWEHENGIGETKIIAMTGSSGKDDIKECLNAGYTNHLAKPIKKDKLINTLIENATTRKIDACNNEEVFEEKFVAYVDTNLQDLIPEYLEERQTDINRMQEAMKVQDYETIRKLGHSIKGSGGSFGFDAITAIGANLENAAEVKDPEEVTRLVNELEEYMINVEIIYE